MKIHKSGHGMCLHCGSPDRWNYETECLWKDGDGPCIKNARYLQDQLFDSSDLGFLLWTTIVIAISAIPFFI